jgi:aldehyde:ferredoxin oxidoreductase
MAGYATGETFFVSQALGLRHSHLDAAGYTYDQKSDSRDVEAAVGFLLKDERERVFLTCMVSCLFARGVYSSGILGECLGSLGYGKLAENMDSVSEGVQKLRWKVRFKTGYEPSTIGIPKRFKEITTWKGPMDVTYMEMLKDRYRQAIESMGR